MSVKMSGAPVSDPDLSAIALELLWQHVSSAHRPGSLRPDSLDNRPTAICQRAFIRLQNLVAAIPPQ
jgi:hypothetical protein